MCFGFVMLRSALEAYDACSAIDGIGLQSSAGIVKNIKVNHIVFSSVQTSFLTSASFRWGLLDSMIRPFKTAMYLSVVCQISGAKQSYGIICRVSEESFPSRLSAKKIQVCCSMQFAVLIVLFLLSLGTSIVVVFRSSNWTRLCLVFDSLRSLGCCNVS